MIIADDLLGDFCARPGSLLFCPDCGTLLNLPFGDESDVRCDQCGRVEPASCVSRLPICAFPLDVTAAQPMKITRLRLIHTLMLSRLR